MKVILEPNVHLLARPVFTPHPEYQIPRGANDAESIVAHAGKGCYDSYGEDGRNIIEHIRGLIKSKHGSVLEHVNFTVFITGVSRGLSHELVRHRAGFAYSQRSTRFTDEEKAAMVLSPYMAELYKKMGANDDVVEKDLIDGFIAQCHSALDAYGRAYRNLISANPDNLEGTDLRKWARGQARQLLPHALETRLTVTGNIRAWRHFFEQRSSRWAEDEIRRLSAHVWNAIAEVGGITLADYKNTDVRGIPEFTTEHTKV